MFRMLVQQNGLHDGPSFHEEAATLHEYRTVLAVLLQYEPTKTSILADLEGLELRERRLLKLLNWINGIQCCACMPLRSTYHLLLRAAFHIL